MENKYILPVKFNGKAHEEACYKFLKESKVSIDDDEAIALIYTLTITDHGRYYFYECFNPKSHHINPTILQDPLLCSTDRQIIRLAFNLYSSRVPSSYQKSNHEYDNVYSSDQEFAYNTHELIMSTTANIFGYGNIYCYLLEAIKLRYRLFNI